MQTRIVPQIRPLTDLRACMNEITSFVDSEKTPVIFTKHGHGKYVFMSLEEYSELIARYDLYEHLQEGLDDVTAQRTMPFDTFIADLRKDMNDGKV